MWRLSVNRWNPCSRQDFIRRLWALGFTGPAPGGRHHLMRFQGRRLTLPSNNEYSVSQVRLLLRQVSERIGREITLEEWNDLD